MSQKAGGVAFSVRQGLGAGQPIQNELAQGFDDEGCVALYGALTQSKCLHAAAKIKNLQEGAATTVFAATSSALEGKGGVYLEDCHVAEVNDEPTSDSGVRSYALDPKEAARLREACETWVCQKF